MATTDPDEIFYPDNDSPDGYQANMAAMAGTVQDALDVRQIRLFKWANSTEREAETRMTESDIGDQQDTDTRYRYNGSAWVADGFGPALLIPTSVSGTGVSMSTRGVVSFTNASTVSVDGVFTTAYRRFRLEIYANTLGAGVPLIGLRAGGSTIVTANSYDKQRLNGVNATASAAQLLDQTVWDLGVAAFIGFNLLDVTLIEPAEATATFGSFSNAATPNPMTTSAGISIGTILQTDTTAVDGFLLDASVGNLTGSLSVYGLS